MPKPDLEELYEKTKVAPRGGRLALLERPENAEALALVRDYLEGCKKRSLEPSYATLSAWLVDHYGLKMATNTLRDYCRRNELR